MIYEASRFFSNQVNHISLRVMVGRQCVPELTRIHGYPQLCMRTCMQHASRLFPCTRGGQLFLRFDAMPVQCRILQGTSSLVCWPLGCMIIAAAWSSNLQLLHSQGRAPSGLSSSGMALQLTKALPSDQSRGETQDHNSPCRTTSESLYPYTFHDDRPEAITLITRGSREAHLRPCLANAGNTCHLLDSAPWVHHPMLCTLRSLQNSCRH